MNKEEMTLYCYNKLAAEFGWLPFNLSLSSGNLAFRDAAERCRGLYPELAAELEKLVK